MSVIGVGGGGSPVNALTSAATGGAAAAVLPQTGLLPQTGGDLSALMLATVAAAIAVIVSLVSSKLYKRSS